MAAADVPGSLVGGRATKGLLLIFTLLSLVYVTDSLEAATTLEILKSYDQGGLEEAANKMVQLDNDLTSFVGYFQEDVDNIAALVKQLKAITQWSHYLKELPTVVTDFLHEKIQKANDDVEAYRKEMEDIWAYIQSKKEHNHEML